MKLWWYAILMLGLQLPLTAAAEENAMETIPVDEFRLALALGYGRLDNPRVHAKPIETFLLPSWSYYSERFYLENFTLGYSLYESDNWLFDLQTKLNEDGFFFEFDGLNKLFLSDIIGFSPYKGQVIRPNGNSEPILDEIQRHISYLGGVSVTWVTPYTDINLGLFQDISGVHDGNELQLRLKKSLLYSWGALGLELGAIRKSESLVRYYYQLTPEESGPLRLSYTPSASINYHARLLVNLPLWQDINLVMVTEYTWLDSGITNSPMIDKDGYLSGFIGLSYRF
ncbi:MipA/OmpV family protein [Shewanella algae]|uniref:MipA/OmpV family protein n=1 Tax=Shewanella algae TaxID=38313 RepID=UPI001F374435|nr:MipA/OmpV family protein [Shewanella algae]MCE9776424.1 MipA/OmpV family protein [Shewanella algae]